MEKIQKIKWITFLLLSLSTNLCAQINVNLSLAREYFQKGECDKAITEYENIIKEAPEYFLVVYPQYKECLWKSRSWKDLEKLIEKAAKEAPDNPAYKIDLLSFYEEQGEKRKAEKTYQQLVDKFTASYEQAVGVVHWLMEKQQWAWAKAFIKEARRRLYEYAFAIEMAEIYALERNVEAMLDEYLLIAYNDPAQIDLVKQALQEQFDNQALIQRAEQRMLELSRQYPDEKVFLDLLIWLYVQKGDFDNAFLLSRAMDKRFQLNGQHLFQMGMIAYYNRAYEAADRFFTYIKQQYKDSYLSYAAARYSIASKEALIKQQNEHSQEQLQRIAEEYRQMIRTGRGRPEVKEAYTGLAFLYANYLHQADSALYILDEALKTYPQEKEFVAWAKIQKGDVLLLIDQPWEAALLYAQAAKEVKDSPVAYEAKLRRAKLFYYTGEFELAKEYFNILKAATSRQIANDALQMSLLISENQDSNSTSRVLLAYAKADLLFFQQQYASAYRLLDSLKQQAGGHPIMDDILWMQAKIAKQWKKYEEASAFYRQIVEQFGYEIWADDALFELMNLYYHHYKDHKQAAGYALRLIKEHPDSIYISQARFLLQKIEQQVN